MDKSHLNPTKRFSSRAENYLKYRPHYPDEIIDHLKKENVLNEKSVVADIGKIIQTGENSTAVLDGFNHPSPRKNRKSAY